MRPSRLRGLSPFLLLLVLGARALAQSPIVSYPEPPSSIEELWRHSDSFSYVRVLSTKLRVPSVTRPNSAQAIREHSLQVLELFKGTVPPGGLTMAQEGGSVIVGGREVVTPYSMKLLEVGSEEVVFLQFWKSENTFVSTYGPPGIFPLQADRANFAVPESMRRSSLFAAAKQVPKQAFLERLRLLREKR